MLNLRKIVFNVCLYCLIYLITYYYDFLHEIKFDNEVKEEIWQCVKVAKRGATAASETPAAAEVITSALLQR